MPRISQLTELTVAEPTDMVPIYEASTGLAKKISVAHLTGLPDVGWTASGESWSYASWSSTTRIGTITVPTDATTKYTAGIRVRISQSTGGTKYGIIVLVAATLLTVFFPSGTTLNNEAISSPVYSSVKVPVGFNADPILWTLTTTSTTNRSTTSSSFATLTDNLVIAIGAWKLQFFAYLRSSGTSLGGGIVTTVSLSSSGTTETNPEITLIQAHNGSGTGLEEGLGRYTSISELLLASQTTFTMIGKNTGAGTTAVDGATASTIIKAICAYL